MSPSDAFALGGLLLVAAGCALIYPPAGVIALGAELLLLGLGWDRS